MAGNTPIQTPETWVDKSPEKKLSWIKLALAALALSVATSQAVAETRQDVENTVSWQRLELAQWNTVHFVWGGTGELYERWWKYYLRDWNSESGTDHLEWTMIIDGKVFLVSWTDDWNIDVVEFKSQIWIDYSKYWQEKVSNLLAWEAEYLAAIEPIIQSKPEKIRDKIRWVFYRNWERALDEVNDGNWEISWAYLRLLIEQTPNMVAWWEDFGWEYKQIYNNQQAKAEAQQAKAELEKETKLYNALHWKK